MSDLDACEQGYSSVNIFRKQRERRLDQNLDI